MAFLFAFEASPFIKALSPLVLHLSMGAFSWEMTYFIAIITFWSIFRCSCNLLATLVYNISRIIVRLLDYKWTFSEQVFAICFSRCCYSVSVILVFNKAIFALESKRNYFSILREFLYYFVIFRTIWDSAYINLWIFAFMCGPRSAPSTSILMSSTTLSASRPATIPSTFHLIFPIINRIPWFCPLRGLTWQPRRLTWFRWSLWSTITMNCISLVFHPYNFRRWTSLFLIN
jgi:hypothetical protein